MLVFTQESANTGIPAQDILAGKELAKRRDPKVETLDTGVEILQRVLANDALLHYTSSSMLQNCGVHRSI
jgi:hypothetical protein